MPLGSVARWQRQQGTLKPVQGTVQRGWWAAGVGGVGGRRTRGARVAAALAGGGGPWGC